MEYKIKTNYTKDMIIGFKRFTLNKKSFLKPAILYLLCIAVIVCSFIYNRKFELNFTTVIYPAIAIIGGIIITMVYYVKPKSDISQLENKEVEYIFNNEGVLLGEDLVKYEDFFGIYETNDYFYFFITDGEGFLIDKEVLDFDLKSILENSDINKKKLKLLKKAKIKSVLLRTFFHRFLIIGDIWKLKFVDWLLLKRQNT